MSLKKCAMKSLFSIRTILIATAALQFCIGGELAMPVQAREPAGKAPKGDSNTATPIKHVIVIVGENRSFDHLFAAYVPSSGETVNNLLSEQIINPNGSPGPNYSQAVQYSADITGSATFQLGPTTGKMPYSFLPAPLNGGPSNICVDNGMCNLGDAVSSEDGLPKPPFTFYESLLVGGGGLSEGIACLGYWQALSIRLYIHIDGEEGKQPVMKSKKILVEFQAIFWKRQNESQTRWTPTGVS
jgi:phospholipase C